MSNIDDDTVSNTSNNETLEQVAARVSRRQILGGGLTIAAASSLGGIGTLLNAVTAQAKPKGEPLLGFQGIPVSSADTVVVPPGYTAKVLIAWGDPVSDGPAFLQDASNTAAEQALQWGMHNDGMVYFPIKGSRRGLLVQNNEYTDDVLLFPDGTANWNQEKTNKSLNAHGVSIIEIANKKVDGGDDDEADDDDDDARQSQAARRMDGGASVQVRPSHHGHDADRDRRTGRGRRPAGHQRRSDGQDRSSARSTTARWASRRGARTWRARRTSTATSARPARRPSSSDATASPRRAPGYLWHTTDKRFDADEEPNEANRFGWVVEIDPFDPARRRSSAPRSAGSSTKAPGCRRRATAASSSTSAMTRCSSTSTGSCRGCRGGRRGRRASTRSTTGRCTWPSSTTTATGSGCR